MKNFKDLRNNINDYINVIDMIDQWTLQISSYQRYPVVNRIYQDLKSFKSRVELEIDSLKKLHVITGSKDE